MLRSEHVIARLQRGRLVPHRLFAENERVLDTAQTLCELYATHVNAPRTRLEEELTLREEELGPRLDARRGFKIVRALAKLLEERAEWASPTTTDPYTLRTRIFELAATLPEPPAAEPGLLETTTREDVLSQVSRETDLEDPSRAHVRRSARLTNSGRIRRANAGKPYRALQRGTSSGHTLCRPKEMIVDIEAGADARLVFHYVKRLGLIYRLEPTPRRLPAPPRRPALTLRGHPQVRAPTLQVPAGPPAHVPLETLGEHSLERPRRPLATRLRIRPRKPLHRSQGNHGRR